MPPDLIDQPSAMPTRKMLAVAIAGVIAAALTQWFDQLAALTPWLEWLASDGVKAAVPVLAAFAAGYLVRERAPAEPAKPGDWPESAARLQSALFSTFLAAAMMLLALLALTACANPPPIVVTAQEIVEKAETPRERVFAAMAVFERLAESATRYAEQPTTSAAEVEAILGAVARGEDAARLARLVAAREDACLAEQEAMEAPPDAAALLCGRTAEYEGLAAALEAARAELQRHVGPGGA